MHFEVMGLHAGWEIWWNVGLGRTNNTPPPSVYLVERLLLSMQALSQLQIHTDEIVLSGTGTHYNGIWLLPAAKAINRGTSMIAPSGAGITRAEFSTGRRQRTKRFKHYTSSGLCGCIQSRISCSVSNYCSNIFDKGYYLLWNRNHISYRYKLSVM